MESKKDLQQKKRLLSDVLQRGPFWIICTSWRSKSKISKAEFEEKPFKRYPDRDIENSLRPGGADSAPLLILLPFIRTKPNLCEQIQSYEKSSCKISGVLVKK